MGARRILIERIADYEAPLRDRLAMWVMRQAGLPASRVNHVRLTVNGQPYGLYQNIEAVDHEFLEDWFPDPSGNLYDEQPELETNKSIGDTSDLDAWDEALYAGKLGTNTQAYFDILAKILDVHHAVRVMAVEIVLPTCDNLKDGGGNFYLYHDPVRGFVVIPWDLDDTFSVNAPSSQPVASCQGPPGFTDEPSRFCQRVHELPSLEAELYDEVVRVRDEVAAHLPEKVDAWCAQTRADVIADPFIKVDAGDFDADCAAIRKHAVDRVAFLKTALAR
jgi:hypothetical protein